MDNPEENSPVTALHKLMEQVDGDITSAAVIAGLTPAAMRKRLMEHAETAERWLRIKINPPSEDQSFHNPKAIQLPSDEEKIARAFQRQDDELKQGLQRMGLSNEALDMVVGLRAFGANHFKTSYEIANASATRTGIMLQIEYDRTSKRLGEVRGALQDLGFDSERRGYLVMEEKGLMDVLNGISDQIRKMLATANQSAQTMAVITKESQLRTMKKVKPGFVDDRPPDNSP